MLITGILRKDKIVFVKKNKNLFFFDVYNNKFFSSICYFESFFFFFNRKDGSLVLKSKLRKKKKRFNFFFFKKVIKATGWGYDLIFDKKTNFLTLKAERNVFYSIFIPKDIYIYFPQKTVLKKTIINFYSQNYNMITLFLNTFKNLKKPNPYTGKGLFYNYEVFSKKKFLKA